MDRPDRRRRPPPPLLSSPSPFPPSPLLPSSSPLRYNARFSLGLVPPATILLCGCSNGAGVVISVLGALAAHLFDTLEIPEATLIAIWVAVIMDLVAVLVSPAIAGMAGERSLLFTMAVTGTSSQVRERAEGEWGIGVEWFGLVWFGLVLCWGGRGERKKNEDARSLPCLSSSSFDFVCAPFVPLSFAPLLSRERERERER